jgi:hypothetical protein
MAFVIIITDEACRHLLLSFRRLEELEEENVVIIAIV